MNRKILLWLLGGYCACAMFALALLQVSFIQGWIQFGSDDRLVGHVLLALAAVFGLLFLLLWIAASQSPGLPDMWGYHVQAIQWIHQYPAIEAEAASEEFSDEPGEGQNEEQNEEENKG